MTKFEAIVHLYRTRKIGKEKAFELALSRGLSDAEIVELEKAIHGIDNPPEIEGDDE